MDIRQEQAGDREAVIDVHRRAFGTHGDSVAALAGALGADIEAHGGASYVAEIEGQVVANIMFSRSLLDAPKELVRVDVLSPVGVLPELHGQGIGSALIRYGLAQMEATDVPAVFLEGDPRYYSRFGFLAGGELGFRKPSLRIPDPAFQVYRLPAYQDWMTGTLVYNEIFWQLDCVGLRED